MTSDLAITPLHAHVADGEPYDFGTHANDFLVRRERALATETFLVRVPGGGAVPPHAHTDMEQTFVFLSGVGTVTLVQGGEMRSFACRPGDTVFVPTGWRHTVAADSPHGLAYLTVNAFVPDVSREGGSAVSHATLAHQRFQEQGSTVPHAGATSAGRAIALFHTAETTFRPGHQHLWAEDFGAHDTVLRADPSAYRVRRVGPFEYVTAVEPCPSALTPEVADLLAAAADGLPVLVEGSQSPLSVKQPCPSSDLDLLVAVRSADELAAAGKTAARLQALQPQVPVPLAVGIVHEGWLRLPGFYSALRLDPASPDRRWWHAAAEDLAAEARRRIQGGLALLNDPERLERLLHASLSVAGLVDAPVLEWRVAPRWLGYEPGGDQ